MNDHFLTELQNGSNSPNGGDAPTSTSPSGLPSRESLRRQRRKREQARRKRRQKRAIGFLITLIALGAIAAAVWFVILPRFNGEKPAPVANDYPGPGSGSVEVVINPGDSGARIGEILAEAGVIKTAKAFVNTALNNSSKAAQIQPGRYELRKEMSSMGALDALLDPESRLQVRVTIQEGWRASQIYERLASLTDVTIEDLEAAAEDTEAIGLPAEANGNVEGWLFPATYPFETDTTAEEMLATMVSQTVTVLDRLEIPNDEREEVLIRASILEKEGAYDDDFAKIARVIQNRIDRDMTLGMDSTIAYGLDKSGLDLTRDDLRSDHPYNTRVHLGLPPGPIASPSERAIAAVLDPPEGNWLFFVTTNPDEQITKFTESHTEHQKNKKEYEEWFRNHMANKSDEDD